MSDPREIAKGLTKDEREAWVLSGTLVVAFRYEAHFLDAIEGGLAQAFPKAKNPQTDRHGMEWWLAEPTPLGLAVRAALEEGA